MTRSGCCLLRRIAGASTSECRVNQLIWSLFMAHGPNNQIKTAWLHSIFFFSPPPQILFSGQSKKKRSRLFTIHARRSRPRRSCHLSRKAGAFDSLRSLLDLVLVATSVRGNHLAGPCLHVNWKHKKQHLLVFPFDKSYLWTSLLTLYILFAYKCIVVLIHIENNALQQGKLKCAVFIINEYEQRFDKCIAGLFAGVEDGKRILFWSCYIHDMRFWHPTNEISSDKVVRFQSGGGNYFFNWIHRRIN